MRIFPLVILTGALCTPLWADPVFLPGVTLEDGWYDCNKKRNWTWEMVKNPNNPLNPPVSSKPTQLFNSAPEETNMCWAAAASNVLQWWQDSRTDIKETTPNGESSTYKAGMPHVQQLAIFETIIKAWTNQGGCVEQAYNYWINGGMLNTGTYPSKSTINTGANQGGYWQELGLIVPESQSGAQVSNPLFMSYSFYDANTLQEVEQQLMNSINNGYGTTLSLAVSNNGQPGPHAVTMWGYEQQADGSLILYLTDSDDFKEALVQKKVVLATKTDSYTNTTSNYFFLVDPDHTQPIELEETFDPEETYVADLLREVQSFTAPRGNAFAAVPEPASATLALASLFGLVLRRRR